MPTQRLRSPRYSDQRSPARRRKKHNRNVIWLDEHLSRPRSRSPRALLHVQEVVRSQVVPFPPGGRKERPPVNRRDVVFLPPFLDPLVVDGVSGRGDLTCDLGIGASQGAEQIVERRKHGARLYREKYSLQPGSIAPETGESPRLTISRMGRGKTPIEFNRLLAQRLRAARIGAGYDKMPGFAREVGVEWETYKKWEQGKTPIPHHHILRVCELTGKDANYFYGMAPEQLRKAAS
jgi:hypothetical protein